MRLVNLVLILLSVYFGFSGVLPWPLRQEAVWISVQLVGAASMFFLVGYCVAVLLVVSIKQNCGDKVGVFTCFDKHFDLIAVLISPTYIHIATGQVILVIYVYLRSVLNRSSASLFQATLPLQTYEFFAVILVLIVLAIWHAPRANLGLFAANKLKVALAAWLMLYLLILLIVQRDLPREIGLSSDPDLHAFWATQIERLGGVPIGQGAWGERNFGYPAGYAVLNYLWSSLSGVTVLNVVTVQPLLQAQLAFIGLMQFCLFFFRVPAQKFGVITGAVAVLLVYYNLLPYGWQPHFYHLEGSGRVSSLLLFAQLGVLLFLAICIRRVAAARQVFKWFFIMAVATLVVATLVNPANFPIAAYLLGTTCFFAGASSAKLRSIGLWVILLSFAFFAGLLLLSDPYYYDLIFQPSRPAVYSKDLLPFSLDRIDMSIILKVISSNLISGRIYLDFLTIDLLPVKYILALLLALVLLGLAWSFSIKKFGNPIWVLLLSLLILFPLFLVLKPSLDIATSGTSLYLLAPYVRFSFVQWMTLWLFAVLAVILTVALNYVSRDSIKGSLLLLVMLLSIPLMQLIRERVGLVNLKPRFGYCGSLGCVKASDKRVIKKLESIYHKFSVKEAKADQKRIPKILIASWPIEQGVESWLFPVGASRILPLYETFPVAFFYFQGDGKYSYQRYYDSLCSSFDRKWLRTNDIRYLFLPSERPVGCLFEAKRLRRQKRKVMYRAGRSYLIELY